MLIYRIQSTLLSAAFVLTGGLLLTACPQGDVGAPCNHGSVVAPSSKLVTFPALSCSDLLCVYGEEKTVPEIGCDSSSPNGDDTCNNAGSEPIFQCVDNTCRLSLDYVLERSMCSKTCEIDDDCNNTTINNRPAVDDEDTACASGFSCAVLQRLGQFCCQKVCVCNDDLDTLDDLAEECTPGTGDAWLACNKPDEETNMTGN